ncbi:hypothetical protein [Streptomyces sp. NPDC001492]
MTITNTGTTTINGTLAPGTSVTTGYRASHTGNSAAPAAVIFGTAVDAK